MRSYRALKYEVKAGGIRVEPHGRIWLRRLRENFSFLKWKSTKKLRSRAI